jgi:hypothetical protein
MGWMILTVFSKLLTIKLPPHKFTSNAARRGYKTSAGLRAGFGRTFSGEVGIGTWTCAKPALRQRVPFVGNWQTGFPADFEARASAKSTPDSLVTQSRLEGRRSGTGGQADSLELVPEPKTSHPPS